MWKARVLCFFIRTVCLLDICCALIGYEGENFTFYIGYPPDYEKNNKYFGRSDRYFFVKLVQTTESNRWAQRGRYALLDNSSAHFLSATIFGLISEDSAMYSFGVDVKLLPDPDTQIQLTVKRGKTQRPTTSLPRVFVSSTNSPENHTTHNWAETRDQESHPRFVTVLSLVCFCTLLVVCPFALFKVLKWAATHKLSVSVSFHTRTSSDHIVDEYVKMSPVVLSNTSQTSTRDEGYFVQDFHRPINSQQTPDKDTNYIDLSPADDLDHIYEP